MGNVELPGERLEAPRDLADLLHAGLRVPGPGHKLHVVDDQEAERLSVRGQLRLHAPRLRPHLQHAAPGLIVDPDRRGVQVPRRRPESAVLLSGETPRAQSLRVHAPLGAEEALHELSGRHLKREDPHRTLMLDRRRRCHVERERRFPHRGPGGDDDEVPALEPRRHAVEVGEAGGHARDTGPCLLELLDVLEGVPQDRLDRDEALALVAVRDLEDPLLGLVEDVVDRALPRIVRVPHDLVGLLHEAPQERLLPHDTRVVLDVGRGGHGRDEVAEVVDPAHPLELIDILQLLRDGDDVDDLTAVEEPHHRAEDVAIPLPVEHPGVEHLDDPRDRIAVDEHPSEHRRLRLDRVGRIAIGDGRRRGSVHSGLKRGGGSRGGGGSRRGQEV